jgi:DNA-binding transcriptional LysR family regulator
MDRRIELRHLRYFIAVAENLHFGRAAQQLNLAQPPLSQQIRQLEAILGYPLFLRNTRSVRLTPAGEIYLERTRRIFHSLERDIREMQQVAQGQMGSLHVGFVGSAMLTGLPGILRAHREAYPSVELHLNELYSSRISAGLEGGTLDIGILRDADPSASLHIETLYTEPFVALLPAHHPLAKRRTLSPAALRDEPFVFYPRSASIRAYEKPLSICESFGFRPHIAQEATHWLTILRLVGTGIGVSIAPACVRSIVSNEAVCIPFRDVSVVSHVEIAWRNGDDRAMIDRFAQLACKDHPRLRASRKAPANSA